MTVHPAKWMIMLIELYVGRLIVRKILPDVLSLIHISMMIMISPFITTIAHRGLISVIIIHDAIIISSGRHSSFFLQ